MLEKSRQSSPLTIKQSTYGTKMQSRAGLLAVRHSSDRKVIHTSLGNDSFLYYSSSLPQICDLQILYVMIHTQWGLG